MYIHRIGQDLLQVAASEFNKLIGKKVKLILGRKGRSEEVTIVFDSSDFHHLAGLHKLKDIQVVYKKNAKLVFNDILKGEISINDITKSTFFPDIAERIEIISQINDIFTKDNLVFKFSRINILNSKILWQYLLEFMTVQGYHGYLFLNKYRRQPGNYVCVTDFKKRKDYSLGQINMTLLQTTLIDGAQQKIIFKNPSYNPNMK